MQQRLSMQCYCSDDCCGHWCINAMVAVVVGAGADAVASCSPCSAFVRASDCFGTKLVQRASPTVDVERSLGTLRDSVLDSSRSILSECSVVPRKWQCERELYFTFIFTARMIRNAIAYVTGGQSLNHLSHYYILAVLKRFTYFLHKKFDKTKITLYISAPFKKSMQ